jgi:branched-chain amino acid transport system permease protein
MTVLAQTLVDGLVTAAIFAAIGVAFNVVYRSGRVFNIAQGELLLLATFSSLVLLDTGLSPWLVFPIVLVLMSVVGLAVERFVLRRLIGRSEMSLFVSTLGVLLVLNGLVVAFLGGEPRLFPNVLGAGRLDIGGVRIDQAGLIGTLLVVAAVLAVAAFFSRTRTGLAMTAVAEDHQVARSLGINVSRSMAISWVIAGALSVVAVIAYMGGRTVAPDISAIALVALPVVLLAGVETVAGVLLAAAIVGVGQAVAARWLDPLTSGGASVLFPFVLMLVILVVRPQGLFGWKRVARL